MMMVAAMGLCVGIALGRWRVVAATAVLVLLVVAPIVAVIVLLGAGALAVARRALRPRIREDDEALLAELVELGLTAGLTFPAAVEAAAAAVPGDESARLRRAGRIHADPGSEPSADPGLFLVARRALATGASLAPAVSGYATALRNEERSRQLTAARRLPVKLLFPLALLILPGFLLLTVGPAVLGSLERLGL
jgi:tight adherence protein C